MKPKVLYRIYTQDTPGYRIIVDSLVSERFNAYTVIKAQGVWNDQREDSLIVEVIADEGDAKNIRGIATLIRSYNNQEAVMVTATPIQADLV